MVIKAKEKMEEKVVTVSKEKEEKKEGVLMLKKVYSSLASRQKMIGFGSLYIIVLTIFILHNHEKLFIILGVELFLATTAMLVRNTLSFLFSLMVTIGVSVLGFMFMASDVTGTSGSTMYMFAWFFLPLSHFFGFVVVTEYRAKYLNRWAVIGVSILLEFLLLMSFVAFLFAQGLASKATLGVVIFGFSTVLFIIFSILQKPLSKIKFVVNSFHPPLPKSVTRVDERFRRLGVHHEYGVVTQDETSGADDTGNSASVQRVISVQQAEIEDAENRLSKIVSQIPSLSFSTVNEKEDVTSDKNSDTNTSRSKDKHLVYYTEKTSKDGSPQMYAVTANLENGDKVVYVDPENTVLVFLETGAPLLTVKQRFTGKNQYFLEGKKVSKYWFQKILAPFSTKNMIVDRILVVGNGKKVVRLGEYNLPDSIKSAKAFFVEDAAIK